jgi:hydrophobic/amphiphilic exporter-1 (mainly G- bacteria), HAE1 family
MKLADVSIRRPVLATVMVGALLVFGIEAYPRIGVDLFPDVEFPVVTVTAVYPGADPETVESKVVDKIEEALSTIEGVKVLRSTSMENVGLVFVQFELERKADQAVQDVRDKVARVMGQLPPDLDPPVIEKFDVGAAPILSLAVAGPGDVREVTRIAKDVIKQRLQSIRGVGGIDLVGGREREFHAWIDPRRLEAFGLAAGDVVAALGAQNVEIPGGRIETGARELVVKTRGLVRSADELSRIVVSSAGGAPVRLADVARVEDGVEEARSYSALDARSAVALVIRKRSGANTVEVAGAVRQALDRLRPQLPAGVTVATPIDNSTFIEHAIHDVQFDLSFGALLAVIIILLFLHDWRATLIGALAIPTSVIATFAFVRAMGFTFNNMTMLALSLSIGILVDDAIVIIENIHRHLEQGKPALRAASEATAEIGLAVMATTASVVAVFVPVATMKGIIGRFFLQFGLTVAFAVLVSLFVAFTLTPMLSARMLRAHRRPGRIAERITRVLAAVDRAYRRVLGWALVRPKTTLGIAVGTLVLALGIGSIVPVEFLPPEDRSQVAVKVEMPTGTSLDATRRYAEDVAKDVRRVPGVEHVFMTVGGGAQGEVNHAELNVGLVPRRARRFSQQDAIAYLRRVLAGRKGALFAVEPINPIGGGGAFRSAMVQFNIRGRDYAELRRAGDDLVAVLRKSGGYVDLDTTYRGGKPEVSVDIDRDRAADVGVPVAAIAGTLRTFFAGDKATEIPVDGDRWDVRVRLDAPFRTRPADVAGLKVRATSGALVPLANIVAVRTGAGPAKIERQNRQRQVTVFANLQGKALGDAVREIDAAARARVPAHLQTDWAGMGDVMQESMGYLAAALLLAIVMVYLILAAQFESFLHPFTIMLSLPLSLVGALGALALTRTTLNIFSMIGVIMLMGLVTKNAILLVDYTNTLRRKGLGRTEALLEAGPVRLRPILMTTAAMVFGMLPVALALGEGGEQRAPMAVTVIGGLIASTLLTLVVVPVVYSLLDRAGERLLGGKIAVENHAPLSQAVEEL